ncbi:MAG TPA: SCO family protein [Bryobacteraceae bacterium]|jgi:protein SCO1/2
MKIHLAARELLVLALVLGTVHRESAQAASADHGSAEYRGGMVSPPLPKPKFTLTDTSGVPFDLASKTQGYTTLLFFGYTHCPDMCPLVMHMIAHALKAVPPDIANRFKVVFVTTDPARDNPQVLRAYLDHFDKSFIGLTGTQAGIDAAQIAANLPPAKKSAVRSDGAYDVGHAAFVLAYTKDNLAHVIYPVGVKEEDLVHDLQYLADETWARRTP